MSLKKIPNRILGDNSFLVEQRKIDILLSASRMPFVTRLSKQRNTKVFKDPPSSHEVHWLSMVYIRLKM